MRTCAISLNVFAARTHQSLRKDQPAIARFKRPESFVHTRSQTGLTIVASGFGFSVYTRAP
jgi:hypothetical protein